MFGCWTKGVLFVSVGVEAGEYDDSRCRFGERSSEDMGMFRSGC